MSDAPTTGQRRSATSCALAMPTPLRVARTGRGRECGTPTGKRYLDFLAGIAVNSLGHAHPVFVEAISRQAATLAHVSNYFATPAATRPRLPAQAPRRHRGVGARVLRQLRRRGQRGGVQTRPSPRRHGAPRILALKDAFHGRTMGTLALTGKPALQQPFEPMVPGVESLDSSIDALEAALDDRVAALFIEPIKGEAGVVELPEGYLAAARELTERHGALLIVDEIQTGAGRTGKWFAFQHAGHHSRRDHRREGYRRRVPHRRAHHLRYRERAVHPGTHGSTFGGNPLATAPRRRRPRRDRAGRARRERGRPGPEIRAAIDAIESPLVEGCRGQGLLIGVGLGIRSRVRSSRPLRSTA